MNVLVAGKTTKLFSSVAKNAKTNIMHLVLQRYFFCGSIVGFYCVFVKVVMAVSGREFETLVDIPAHVWRGLPDGLRLAPSAVNPNRIGEALFICMYMN